MKTTGSLAIAWLIALPGCTGGATGVEGDPQWSGTAVGNPGNIGLVATDVPGDVSLDGAAAGVGELTLFGCGADDDHAIPVDSDFDLLAASSWPVEVPAGSWCGLSLDLQQLDLTGETVGGTLFDVSLAPGALDIAGAFEVDGGLLLIGLPLGDFLDAAALEALGEEVILDPDDDLSSEWADGAGAELWEDSDGDGQITFEDDAPLAGVADDDTGGAGLVGGADDDDPAAYGDNERATSEAGCSAGPGALGLWWLALLGLGWRRR